MNDPNIQLAVLARGLYGPTWRDTLQQVFQVHRTTIMRWENGSVPIPEVVFVALKCLTKGKRK